MPHSCFSSSLMTGDRTPKKFFLAVQMYNERSVFSTVFNNRDADQ